MDDPVSQTRPTEPWESLPDEVLFSRLPRMFQRALRNDPNWRQSIGFAQLKIAMDIWSIRHGSDGPAATGDQRAASTAVQGIATEEMGRLLRRLGQAIRYERGLGRVTMEWLARRTGMSTSSLSRFERGEASPRFDQLVTIAHAMGISVFRLIEGADDRVCPHCERGRTAHVIACGSSGVMVRLGPVSPAHER